MFKSYSDTFTLRWAGNRQENAPFIDNIIHSLEEEGLDWRSMHVKEYIEVYHIEDDIPNEICTTLTIGLDQPIPFNRMGRIASELGTGDPKVITRCHREGQS